MKPEVVYAPSFTEVNSNNDELRELRGEGRYFGVSDPELSAIVCSNCHQRGHKRSQCKTVVCHLCGKVGDHYETQCPNSMVCTNCGKRGHYRGQCTERHQSKYCTYCDSRSHSTDRCPNVWRSYIVIAKKKLKYPEGRIWCYNCAEEGHFGDNCPYPRVSKTPNINGSAFTGENLPKDLIERYRREIRDLRRPRYERSHDRLYDRAPRYPTGPSSSPASSQRREKRREKRGERREERREERRGKSGSKSGSRSGSRSGSKSHSSSTKHSHSGSNHLPKATRSGYIGKRK